MAATTTSSSSCTGFFRVRDSSSSTNQGSAGCGKLDGVAMWFLNGVTTAFFASLERCSCIRIATEEDVEEANDLPLILNDGNLRHDGGGTATTARRRTGKGKKSTGTAALVVEED